MVDLVDLYVTKPLWVVRLSRPIGGTLVNGLFYSVFNYLGVLTHLVLGYETNPKSIITLWIYLTYIQNLKIH